MKTKKMINGKEHEGDLTIEVKEDDKSRKSRINKKLFINLAVIALAIPLGSMALSALDSSVDYNLEVGHSIEECLIYTDVGIPLSYRMPIIDDSSCILRFENNTDVSKEIGLDPSRHSIFVVLDGNNEAVDIIANDVLPNGLPSIFQDK
jgi:hypothetical protein